MTSPRRIVVIGADAAGMSAAHQALRGARARGRDVSVCALERTQHTSYSACGIPYWVAGDVDEPGQLLARSADQHRSMGVDLRMGVTATRIDLDTRHVHYRDDSGDVGALPFDDLVLATGAPAVVPDWARRGDGSLVPGVHPLKNLDDGAHWLDLLERAGRSARGVVVGGGYVGVEMAEAMVRQGLHATMVTRGEVMSSLDPDMSARVCAAMDAAGVEVLTTTQIQSVESGPDGRVRYLHTTDGRTIPADVVALGLGARPATSLAVEAGIAVGPSGGLQPDDTGRVVDGVWAAGDCCESRNRMTGRLEFVPLGTHANKQGRVVGENVSGGDARFAGVLGTAITRFVARDQHVEISRTGLSTAQAQRAGIAVVSLTTDGRTASGYMPEATPIATKVLAEPGSRRLLGVQIVGGRSAGKRIDTAAAALWGGLSIDDLAAMDLSYAPPFATVWEAVQLAARRLADRMPVGTGV